MLLPVPHLCSRGPFTVIDASLIGNSVRTRLASGFWPVVPCPQVSKGPLVCLEFETSFIKANTQSYYSDRDIVLDNFWLPLHLRVQGYHLFRVHQIHPEKKIRYTNKQITWFKFTWINKLFDNIQLFLFRFLIIH